jgi:integrase
VFVKQRVKEINQLLQEGYHIDDTRLKEYSQAQSEDEVITLSIALEKALKIKLPQLKERTKGMYESALRDFIIFLKKIRKAHLSPLSFNRQDVFKYSDYLMIDKGLASKTRNNYFSYIRSLFTIMVEREWADKNSLCGVRDLKVVPSSLHKPYNDEQIEFLKKEVSERDPFLWSFILFIFYCFVRPAELMRLQIQDIDLENEKLFIPGKISKNGKDGRVALSKFLVEHIKKMKLDQYPDHYLIFSDDEKPGLKVMQHNKLSRRYRSLLNELDYPAENSLYGWKHTGNIKLYHASNKDIILIMKQNRHHSLDMTYNYLRSLGLEVNSAVLENFQL